MSLPLATSRELQKLAALEAKGGILERQYEVIKIHVRQGNSLSSEDWEAFDLAWELRSSGVFSQEEWTTQVDGDISGIINNSDRPTLGVFSQEEWTTQRSTAAAAAAPAARGAPNRGKRQREDASKGSLNIYNSFPIGSGEPRIFCHIPGVCDRGQFCIPGPAPRVRCPHCPTTFLNTEGLGVHMKTNHSTANMLQGQRLQRMLADYAKGDVLPWERAGPGRWYHVKIDRWHHGGSFVRPPAEASPRHRPGI
ncbi:unnamed protein product [Ectocarpus sp. CCAP 1310/34]|nr:unnamed protein product [Ectocarpus sp. CCAP 1310/34]